MGFSIRKQGDVCVVDVDGQLIVGNRQELKQRVLDEAEGGAPVALTAALVILAAYQNQKRALVRPFLFSDVLFGVYYLVMEYVDGLDLSEIVRRHLPLVYTAARRQVRSPQLAEEVASDIDSPPHDKALVDGYAVRAADTFGASESLPAYLGLAGETPMGAAPAFEVALGPWQCVIGKIPSDFDTMGHCHDFGVRHAPQRR